MSRFIWITTLVSFTTLGCQQAEPQPAKPAADNRSGSQVAAGEFTVGEPIQSGNLTIFPVIATVDKDEDRFTTLDEGLAAGTVEVTEIGSGEMPNAFQDDFDEDEPAMVEPDADVAAAGDAKRGDSATASADEAPDAPPIQQQPPSTSEGDVAEQAQEANFDELVDLVQQSVSVGHRWTGRGSEVNRVVVVNRSEKPLYLMPGEIIIGGQQDRSVAKETIIPPGEKPEMIDVFCVEHGRWGLRRLEATLDMIACPDFEHSPDADGHSEEIQQVAEKASKGAFVQSGGAVNVNTRLAVQSGKTQQKVWEEVAKNNAKTGASTDSGTFTANFVQSVVVDKLQPHIDALGEPVAKTPRIVGVIVAINGKMTEADVFESTPLFRKLWPKLLKTYALDAAAAAREEDPVACSVDDAQAFLTEAMEGNIEETHTGQGLVVAKRSTSRVDSFGCDECEHAAGTGGGGGFGGGGFGIHGTAFSK